MAEQPNMRAPVLALRGVNKAFHSRGAEPVHVAKNVNLTIQAGETVALIGESGSGKSSLARVALGLLKPDSGDVRLLDKPLFELSALALRTLRLNAQPVFQDSSAAFNPRRTALQLLSQPMSHTSMTAAAKREKALSLLNQVGLKPAADYLARFPHELSGGQRQRLAIARAIAMDPALIIADEPLSGADVSIRGQILNLLIDLQTMHNVAYLFITHDLLIARAFAHRVAVMYRGEIVEQGAAEDVLVRPSHPYTQRLLASSVGVDDLASHARAG